MHKQHFTIRSINCITLYYTRYKLKSCQWKKGWLPMGLLSWTAEHQEPDTLHSHVISVIYISTLIPHWVYWLNVISSLYKIFFLFISCLGHYHFFVILLFLCEGQCVVFWFDINRWVTTGLGLETANMTVSTH